MVKKFITDNLWIAIHLANNELNYIGATQDTIKGKKQVFFEFEDPNDTAKTLERGYYKSNTKSIKDHYLYFRSEIHKQIQR